MLVAQTIHAAGESTPGPLPPNTYAVALATRDEAELCALEERLKSAGIAHAAIREPDAPWNGALMAVGIVPCDRTQVRRFVSNLPLLR